MEIPSSISKFTEVVGVTRLVGTIHFRGLQQREQYWKGLVADKAITKVGINFQLKIIHYLKKISKIYDLDKNRATLLFVNNQG